MHDILCRAVRERRLLMFAYGDRVRVVEPHLYGTTSGGGRILSAWLRPGYSRSTPDGGWRSFRTDDISSLQLLTEHFAGPRAGFNPGDVRMADVYCALDGIPGADTTVAPPEPPDAAHTPAEDPPRGAVGA